MGRPRKDANRVVTRDPQYTTRDPVIVPVSQPEEPSVTAQQRPHRLYIPANMPTVCPKCGHNTRVDGNRYIDPVRKRIVEYRECIKCRSRLGCGRDMTKSEIEKFCTHAEAVAEYQQESNLTERTP